MTHPEWRTRRLSPEDSLEELTALLHRAYAPLAERGLRYLATHQDVETTRSRVAKGDCFVAATSDAVLVGTIVVYPPSSGLDHGNTSGARGPAVYARSGVATFGQFGVEPAWKGRGLGRALHAFAEEHARGLGASVLACDTAEPANELIAMYQRWGYVLVERMRWEVTNYDSVVLAKPLTPDAIVTPLLSRLEEPA